MNNLYKVDFVSHDKKNAGFRYILAKNFDEASKKFRNYFKTEYNKEYEAEIKLISVNKFIIE